MAVSHSDLIFHHLFLHELICEAFSQQIPTFMSQKVHTNLLNKIVMDREEETTVKQKQTNKPKVGLKPQEGRCFPKTDSFSPSADGITHCSPTPPSAHCRSVPAEPPRNAFLVESVCLFVFFLLKCGLDLTSPYSLKNSPNVDIP